MSAPATRAETDGGGLAGTVGHQIAEPPAYLEVEVIEDAHLTALLWKGPLDDGVNAHRELVPYVVCEFCSADSFSVLQRDIRPGQRQWTSVPAARTSC